MAQPGRQLPPHLLQLVSLGGRCIKEILTGGWTDLSLPLIDYCLEPGGDDLVVPGAQGQVVVGILYLWLAEAVHIHGFPGPRTTLIRL